VGWIRSGLRVEPHDLLVLLTAFTRAEEGGPEQYHGGPALHPSLPEGRGSITCKSAKEGTGIFLLVLRSFAELDSLNRLR